MVMVVVMVVVVVVVVVVRGRESNDRTIHKKCVDVLSPNHTPCLRGSSSTELGLELSKPSTK